MTTTPAARVEARGATIDDILEAGMKLAAPAFEATEKDGRWVCPDGSHLAAGLFGPAQPDHVDERAFHKPGEAIIDQWVADVDVWIVAPPADRSWVSTELITDRPGTSARAMLDETWMG